MWTTFAFHFSPLFTRPDGERCKDAAGTYSLARQLQKLRWKVGVCSRGIPMLCWDSFAQKEGGRRKLKVVQFRRREQYF